MRQSIIRFYSALVSSATPITQQAQQRIDVRAWIRLLRPQQYVKNALVFVPVFAAHQFSLGTFSKAAITFLAFCPVASSVYLLNDISDAEVDRLHPTKRNRPIAVGAIPPLGAAAVAPVLLLIGLALASTVSWTLVLVLVAYFCVSCAYSLWLKSKLILDIIVLSLLYCARLLGGAVATSIALSNWLLAFSMFAFAGLALIKRHTELVRRNDLQLVDTSMNRGYELGDREIISALAAASGFNAVTLFALYISSDAVRVLYERPWLLWAICPLFMYGFGRMLLLSHRGLVDDDPIVFAFKDRTSIQVAILAMLIVLLAI